MPIAEKIIEIFLGVSKFLRPTSHNNNSYFGNVI